MKRAFGVWCEYSHNERTGKYQIEDAVFMDFHGNNHVLFNCYNEPHPYQYDSIAQMIKDVVYGLKSRGYYCKWYHACNARWYEIWWKDVNNTLESHTDELWNRYGLCCDYIAGEKHFPNAGRY